MFIPSYRFINFEEFFQPTCLFRPTGLLILSIVYSTLQVYQFWWIFPTYLLTWLAGARRSRYIVTIISGPLMPCPKSFWFSTNHFGQVQLILVGSKLFWTSPNHIKVSPEKKVAKNLFLEKFEWVFVTLLGLKVDP